MHSASRAGGWALLGHGCEDGQLSDGQSLPEWVYGGDIQAAV